MFCPSNLLISYSWRPARPGCGPRIQPMLKVLLVPLIKFIKATYSRSQLLEFQCNHRDALVPLARRCPFLAIRGHLQCLYELTWVLTVKDLAQ